MWRCRPLLHSYAEKVLRATPLPSNNVHKNHRRLLGPPRNHHFTTAVAAEAAASTSPATSPDDTEESSSPPPPPPIVWTTHLLNAEQILKVDKLFHKILWLDMVETAILVEAINTQLGKTLSQPQRNAIQRQMDRLSDGSDGASGESIEPTEAVKDEGPKLVDLKLTGFDAAQKIKVIKEVRAILGLGLKEAKELVEGAPKTLQKGLKPEAAEELRQKLEAAGAQVEVS